MKFKLEITEKITYRHEIIVEANDENELDKACDEVEQELLCNGNDYAMFLREKGFENAEFIEDGSGDLPSVECTDISEINDSECDEDD